MKKSVQDNEENQDIDAVETDAEKAKSTPVQPSIKKSISPIFPNANRFGKGMQSNNMNNRQRPGRAANRGR